MHVFFLPISIYVYWKIPNFAHGSKLRQAHTYGGLERETSSNMVFIQIYMVPTQNE